MAPRKTAAQKAAEAEAKAAEETQTAEAEQPEEETTAQKRSRLRNQAEREILNRRYDEFQDYAEALYAENGLKFQRKLSDQEKAKRKMEELLQQFPELRAQYAPGASHLPAHTVAPPQVSSTPERLTSDYSYEDGDPESEYDPAEEHPVASS